MVVNYQSSVFALMHVPKCYSTNCSQIWKPKVGVGVDEKGIGARRERHQLVPLLRLPYLNAK